MEVVAADDVTLLLPPVLDAGGAAQLRADLLDVASGGGRLLLDASGVVRLGTPSVQVMLAADAQASATGRRFALARPSDAVVAAFQDLGLEDVLQRWSED